MSLIDVTTHNVAWSGHHSQLKCQGPLYKAFQQLAKEFDIDVVLGTHDGVCARAQPRSVDPRGLCPGPREFLTLLAKGPRGRARTLVVMLCAQNFHHPRLRLCPLDDAMFAKGLQLAPGPPWETRTAKVFWRGGATGFQGPPSIRVQTVKLLLEHPLTDVKLTKWYGVEAHQNIPDTCFAARCTIKDHCTYKYLLIIDGAVIASSLQWVFGSGSVPLLLTHPKNRFWFADQLVPYHNYIPVAYDLSDLSTILEWLQTHDEEANGIATHAQELAVRILAPAYQQKYLRSLFSSSSAREIVEKK